MIPFIIQDHMDCHNWANAFIKSNLQFVAVMTKHAVDCHLPNQITGLKLRAASASQKDFIPILTIHLNGHRRLRQKIALRLLYVTDLISEQIIE